MTPKERVQCVLDGERPDRPPVCFWRHFAPDQVFGPQAVKAHLDQLIEFDLDFLKVMDDNPYPSARRVETVRDLAGIERLRGDEPEFERQLDLIAELRCKTAGRVYMTTTIFNAWATMRHLVRKPKSKHSPPNMNAGEDEPSAKIMAMYREDPSAMRAALRTIAENLAGFAARCLDAGADGVFMAVRDDWLEQSQPHADLYDELLTPCDLRVLEAAATGCFNMLHVCGRAVRFRRFADYPVQVINWADRVAGPSIGDVVEWMRPAICAGVDNLNTLPGGSPSDCQAEVHDAIRSAGARPVIIAPGCTYDPDIVPRENLEAVRHAVEP